MTDQRQQTTATIVALLLLSAGVWFTFGQAIDAPFIFDDYFSVIHNDSLRALWPISGPLHPPRDTPFAGRPLVNLSAAVNYHLGQLDPAGYRVFNLVVHVASAMLLFGLVRRTLELDYFPWLRRSGYLAWTAAAPAMAVALLWAVHPLQVESVCYVTQRTELMMGFFYLATLYCSLRFRQAPAGIRRIVWLSLAVAACCGGMASKEVMVSAPLVVLLYDRTFVSRSFKRALSDSWPLYVGLCLSWVLLVLLNADAPRSRSAGFHLSVSPATWWLTQSEVIWLYLRLAFWPWPLSIHHEIPYLHTVGEAWPYLLMVVLLGGATLAALWRNWASGFLGAWFFLILSPTSLVPIATEVAAERRMYLPLAAVVALVVLGGCWLATAAWRRADFAGHTSAMGWRAAALASLALLIPAVSLGALSYRQSTALRYPQAVWRQVLATYPESDLAYVNLGFALMNAGDNREAADCFARALAINPDSPDAHYNWGTILKDSGQPLAAVSHLASAVELDPDNFLYCRAYGNLLKSLGQYPAAVEQLQRAVDIQPDTAAARNDLGMAYKDLGRFADASRQLAEAVRLAPEVAEYRNNYGNALRLQNDDAAAIAQLQKALELRPDMREARFNLALTYDGQGDRERSVDQFRQLLESYPDDVAARTALGNTLFAGRRFDEAAAEFQKAVELQPDLVDARNNLGAALLEMGRTEEAIDQLEEVVRRNPDSVAAHFNLAEAYHAAGRHQEAIAHAERALDLARAAGQLEAARQIEAWLPSSELRESSSASPSRQDAR